METEGTIYKGRPRKTWWDYVKDDIESFGQSHKDSQHYKKA